MDLLPDVIAPLPKGLRESENEALDLFNTAVAEANKNAHIGIEEDIAQKIVDSAGDLRTSMVNFVSQTCNNQICSNNTAVQNDLMNQVWEEECAKRPIESECTDDSCQWMGNRCRKKQDCTAINNEGGCKALPDTSDFVRQNMKRICWGADTETTRGCLHGDLNDPNAPTVSDQCIAFTTMNCPENAAAKKVFSKCAALENEIQDLKALENENIAMGKLTRCQQFSSQLSCDANALCQWNTSTCQTKRASKEIELQSCGKGVLSRQVLSQCKPWVKRNHPDVYWKNTQRLQDDITTAEKMEYQNLQRDNPVTCTAFANNVANCNASGICAWDSTTGKCGSKRAQLQRQLDEKVDRNLTEYCATNACIDKKKSGHKFTCVPFFDGKKLRDCPPGYFEQPQDNLIKYDVPKCDTASCTFCSDGNAPDCFGRRYFKFREQLKTMKSSSVVRGMNQERRESRGCIWAPSTAEKCWLRDIVPGAPQRTIKDVDGVSHQVTSQRSPCIIDNVTQTQALAIQADNLKQKNN